MQNYPFVEPPTASLVKLSELLLLSLLLLAYRKPKLQGIASEEVILQRIER